MKRLIAITILLAALVAGRPASAQEGSAADDWNAFLALSKKNIFDPTRNGSARYGSIPKPKIIRYFTFHGSFDSDAAIFTGEGVARDGFVKVGGTLNGFKVMKLPRVSDIDPPVVILTDPSGAIVELKEGESMRREDEGPWQKTDESAPIASSVASVTESTTSTPEVSAAPASPGAAGESERLRLLRLRREQEDK